MGGLRAWVEKATGFSRVRPGESARHQGAVEARVASGVPLPPAPDGPVVEAFSALHLADALEHEVRRAKDNGMDKIRIDGSIEDAAKLAAFLRRAALMGA